MKTKHLIASIIFYGLSQLVVAQNDTIVGVYTGENLYIQQYVNQVNQTTFEYCIDSIIINDNYKVAKNATSAFEIDLSHYKLNQALSIIIYAKEDCNIKVLNRRALEFKKTYLEIEKVDESKVQFRVDQKIIDQVSLQFFQYNKWVSGHQWTSIDSLNTNKQDTLLVFDLRKHINARKRIVAHLRGGEANDFLVKNLEFSFDNKLNPDCLKVPKKVKEYLEIEHFQGYKIYNSYGELVLEGKGKRIDVQKLGSDKYYLELEFCSDYIHFIKK